MLMHNIHQALDAHLQPRVANAIRVVGTVAHSRGSKAWFVGGLVRDAVLGVKHGHQVPDIVVAGDLRVVARDCISSREDSELLAHSQFQTCRVKLEGQIVELASARTDTYEPHGALPSITPVSDILDDLPRRDFSINAMAVELTATRFGKFHDPFGGLEDCVNSNLRVLHRDAFSEDPTRILRGIRFAARYDLHFVPETACDLHRALPALATFQSKSPDRLFSEFARWFDQHENLHGITTRADELGVLRALHLESAPETNTGALRHLTGSHQADFRFAMFLQTLSDRALLGVSQNLPLTKRWRALAEDTISLKRLLESTELVSVPDSAVAAELRRHDDSVVRSAAMILGNRPFAARLRKVNDAARRTKPFISGLDVAALGITHGPEIGDTLREIVDRRIDGQIATREDEIEYVRSRADASKRG